MSEAACLLAFAASDTTREGRYRGSDRWIMSSVGSKPTEA